MPSGSLVKVTCRSRPVHGVPNIKTILEYRIIKGQSLYGHIPRTAAQESQSIFRSLSPVRTTSVVVRLETLHPKAQPN